MNTKFITDFLKKGAFIYNGIECDNGGAGYILNTGFENIKSPLNFMDVLDIVTSVDDIKNLKI